ncbi:MAG: glycosyltransferase [Actinomycetota bacterium]
MDEINIAFITDRMIKGHGVDLVVDRMADGLAKKGYHTRVYCNYHDETFTKRKSYRITTLPYIRPVRNPVVYERRIRKLVPYFNRRDIDLFVIQSFPFYSLIPKLKKPVLVVDHGIISTKGMPPKRRLFYKYQQLSQNLSYFRKAEKIITVSRFLLDSLPSSLKPRTSVIYNGCNHYRLADIPDEESVARFREEKGIRPGDVLLLFVGRLNISNQPYKGVDELVHIHHHLSAKRDDIKLMAVGYGTENDEALLRNQGIKVIKNAPEGLMPMIYKACDIYITCSKWEGFDLPVAEAHSFKKPAVCYDIGAHPEVARDGVTGFIVKDQAQFIEKLTRLIEDRELRKKLGQSAHQFSKNFHWQDTVDRYDGQIKKILGLKDTDITPRDFARERKPAEKPKVAALVVNYNSSFECLEECIASLKAQTYSNTEILLFDNNSANDVVPSIRKRFSGLKVIRSTENLGLGGAINRALESIDSKYVLISNFDVAYDKRFVEECVNMIRGLDRKYIGLAPKIKFYYMRDFIESVGTYLDKSYYIGYQGIGQLDLDQYDRDENIFGLSFTSAFIKTRIFSEEVVGRIDPTFFLFYEDIDFCYRANLYGYSFRSCPSAIVYHKYAYSFRDAATGWQRRYYYQKLNLLRTLYKNAESPNLYRVKKIELDIQKQNLKDENLRPIARKVVRKFKKSMPHLKKERANIQMSRKVFDEDILKYCWGESNFFDFVENTPHYSLTNLLKTYQRLFALLGNMKYEEYISYLQNLQQTKFRIEIDKVRQLLHSKMEYERLSVHNFIDKLS